MTEDPGAERARLMKENREMKEANKNLRQRAETFERENENLRSEARDRGVKIGMILDEVKALERRLGLKGKEKKDEEKRAGKDPGAADSGALRPGGNREGATG